MGKKYLETKKDSLESSILGVWQTAIEEGEAIKDAAQMTKEVPKEVTKEEVELDEAKFKVSVEGMPPVYMDAKSAGEIKTALRKLLKNPDMINDVERVTDAKIKKDLRGRISGKDAKDDKDDEASQTVKETNKNDKSDDGEGLDAVQPKAVKKKFKNRKDKDIDNDGDVDDSDKFLHKRRKAISKAISKEDVTWENAQRFKVESMKAALAQIWGVKEGHNPFKKEDDDKILKKGGKTLTGKKAAEIDLNPEIKDR